MSGRVRRSLALALAGLLAGLGLVLALFGGESVRHLIGRDEPGPPAASKPESGLRSLADPGAMAGRADPTIDFRDDKPARAEPGQPTGASPSPSPQEVRIPGPGAPGRAAEPDAAETPRFDIVRVEPNGEAVVAGRGAPHAVVEMLVNGKPVARATADANGQFAIVPPALPTGSSVVGLRMTGRDGRAASSQQSVAVDVAPGRDRQPLVALTAPDAATVVLSQPGAPAPAAAPGAPGARIADAGPPGPAGGGASRGGAGAEEAGRQPTRIVSVDVQGNGRLFVTATGRPGAALRLYLNETLIAPGSIGPDGRASFTIGRGIKPGQYQVRIDQIDPATGKVATRAEVPLSVPEPPQVAAHAPAAPTPSAEQVGSRKSAGDGGQEGIRHDGRAAAGPPAPPAPAVETPSGPDTSHLAAETAGPMRAGAVFVPEVSTAKISRGDNLWRISQRTYGRGERYTVIYDANQSQIRDPDLIYPGQIFVLPGGKRG
ncbi:LysM peptidoglycan-binding domain-containing protein [Methylobacterium sp. J-070]|uniref:LysM peptidoglycan-binding domain-containing protein n=1 Tax=Methylobacterium sp. J-070 TaxID=2836650 RepID=UPI001FB8E8EA|nr:LysM peptidoglycan-binding domain-containing protein [Methylobacterium sp. J-070]MCJ2053334.1 LysM peptidoglycan-binding domain-containing protein [Methylobacterium sp. J-070]